MKRNTILDVILRQAGTYTFDVRAVYSDSRHGEWQTSDSFTITAEQAQEIQKTLVFKEAGSGPAAVRGNRMRLDISTAILMEAM